MAHNTIDVAIIGAGPYGLSLAAHLASAGVEFRIFGKPMASWKWSMPAGMLLKSHSWSSNLYDPTSSFTLEEFCFERNIPYHDSDIPVSVKTFVAYGEAFQARFAPNVEDKVLISCDSVPAGVRGIFDDGEIVTARHMIVAVGVHPFKYVPEAFAHLPSDVLSHSSDHGPLDRFAGKHIAILGSGASAIDLAALLHEQGTSVSLVARADQLNFPRVPGARRSFVRRLAYPLVRPFIYPGSGIGTGWLLKFCAEAPHVFHALPERNRLHIVGTTLGPSGSPFMKDRIIGKVSLLLGRNLQAVNVRSGKAYLSLASDAQPNEIIEADHVIAATGYKLDLHQLPFLSPGLMEKIRAVKNTPILSPSYESSVVGLYFIGPIAANSFGPVLRFVFGAVYPARRLVQHIKSRLAYGLISPPKAPFSMPIRQ